jgi:hypothetical protein
MVRKGMYTSIVPMRRQAQLSGVLDSADGRPS